MVHGMFDNNMSFTSDTLTVCGPIFWHGTSATDLNIAGSAPAVWAYLCDVLTRLPTHPARDIEALLPHRWKPPQLVG